MKVLLAVLACGLAASPVSAADLKGRLHSIAVVSAMGDIVFYQPGNSSLFDPERITRRTLDGLDGEIERATRATLSADAPGVTFIPVDVPRETMLSAAAWIYRTNEGAINAVRTALKPWREAHAVDVVIVLLPLQNTLQNHAQWRHFYGMGVSWDEGVVLMQALVLDGKNGEVLGTARIKAIAPLGFAATRDSFLDPALQAKAGLTNYFIGLLDGVVPGLLHDAGL